MAPSPQGEAVRAALDRLDHPTADEIFLEVRKDRPRISLATVYRNLDTLVQQGEAQVRTIGDQKRYDPKTEHHAHLHCVRCDRLVDMDYDTAGLARVTADAERQGFHVTHHLLELQGVCAACAASGPMEGTHDRVHEPGPTTTARYPDFPLP